MEIPAEARALAAAVGRALGAADLRLVTVESCSGGLAAAALTAVPGSSGWFECGLVTYSNEAKTALAGVAPALLARHGAVSEEVAAAMAQGGREAVAEAVAGAAGAAGRERVALSVTGIAGPDGGAPHKPVGMVCFAWAGPWGVLSATRHFDGGRDEVRLQCVCHALRRLLELLS